jgi:WD40 repeat protein
MPQSSPFLTVDAAVETNVEENIGTISENSWLNRDDLAINPFESNFYNFMKKIISEPDMGYDPYTDPLSPEGKSRFFRNAQLTNILSTKCYLANIFKDFDDKSEIHLVERKNIEFISKISSLPSSVTKFEQKTCLTIDDNKNLLNMLVLFHAFHDILVVAHGISVGIWSLASCNKILDIKNKHSNYELTRQSTMNSDASTAFSSLLNPRITSIKWINESYDSLLMVGSEDGMIRIWRDAACSDTSKPPANNGRTRQNESSQAPTNFDVELATAFSALPDVSQISKGSGMVVTWHQAQGTLIVGGNSETIRIWDLGHEQCVATMFTGVGTCVSALATSSLPSIGEDQFSNEFTNSADYNDNNSSSSTKLLWAFAGFGDGSIGVFDQRVSENGGRVHFSRDHSSWVISAHIRDNANEVITSSHKGTVKFWDIRNMRTFRSFEVHKSLTALAMHNCVPIMATGSHEKFIKILSLGNEELGCITHYDGFNRQRIGAINFVCFHPYKMQLAASASNNIVSIYTTADRQSNR